MFFKVTEKRIKKLIETKNIKKLINALKNDCVYVARFLGEFRDKRAVEPLLEALNDKDKETRKIIVIALGEIGDEKAIDKLINLLMEDKKEVRKYAAEALGKIGNKKAIPYLLKALDDKNEEVRKNVVNALDKLSWVQKKDKCSVKYYIIKREWDKCIQLGDVAITPLSKTLNYDKKWVSAEAAKVLGEIGSLNVIDPLINAIINNDHGIRESAEALYKIGGPAVKPLIEILKSFADKEIIDTIGKDKSYYIFNIIVEILQRLKDSVIDELINAVKNEDKGCNVLSKALGRIGNITAVDSLIDALYSKKESLRISAIEALGEIGDKRAVGPLLKLLDENNDNIKTCAIEALGELKDNIAVLKLIDLFKKDNDDIKDLIAEALGKIGDSRAVLVLIESLNDNNIYIRQNAAEALGRIKDNRAIEPLLKILNDNDEYVRHKVIKALGNFRDNRITDKLINILQKDEKCGSLAAVILGDIGDEKAINPLIRALSNKEWNVYDSAIKALVKLGNKAINDLIKELDNNDKWIKVAAIKVLGKIKDENAMKPLLKFITDEEWCIRKALIEAFEDIGCKSIKMLFDYFKESDEDTKLAVVDILDTLYKSDKISDESKKKISLFMDEYSFLDNNDFPSSLNEIYK